MYEIMATQPWRLVCSKPCGPVPVQAVSCDNCATLIISAACISHSDSMYTVPLALNWPAAACRHGSGWFNSGYIFPEGFESRVSFRSSVALDQLCVHECSVLGRGGQYWPGPTFRVRAMDRASEPITAKSCTGCWTGVCMLTLSIHASSGFVLTQPDLA